MKYRLIKGVRHPVCWICDTDMNLTYSEMYRDDYQCPNCKQKWYDELIH